MLFTDDCNTQVYLAMSTAYSAFTPRQPSAGTPTAPAPAPAPDTPVHDARDAPAAGAGGAGAGSKSFASARTDAPLEATEAVRQLISTARDLLRLVGGSPDADSPVLAKLSEQVRIVPPVCCWRMCARTLNASFVFS